MKKFIFKYAEIICFIIAIISLFICSYFGIYYSGLYFLIYIFILGLGFSLLDWKDRIIFKSLTRYSERKNWVLKQRNENLIY